MGKNTKKLRIVGKNQRSLGELIHVEVRAAIERAVQEELETALGRRYERVGPAERVGYRNGVRTRTLTGPTGPVDLTVPRARLFADDGNAEEWRSTPDCPGPSF
jgi:transposase-like protein